MNTFDRHCFLLTTLVVCMFTGGYSQPIKSGAEKSFGKTMKVTPGVVSYTFRNSFQKNTAATLDTIKNLGITNIEFSNLFGNTAAALKQMLDERGMRCTSFGVSYTDLVSKTEEVAENAKILGATFVRVAWIPHEKVPFTIEIARKAVDDFNAAGKILKDKYGLTFCYHNHGYEFQPYENGTYYDYIMANTNPAYVSFELDILWAFHPGKDPAELLRKYGNRIKLMHVKDLRKGVKGDFSGGTAVDNDVALGTGQIDIPAVIKAAKKSAVQNYYIEDESNSVNIQVPKSLAYLKKFVMKVNSTRAVYSFFLCWLACMQVVAQQEQCKAVLQNDTLILENSKIKRSFRWNNGGLQSISLLNKTNGRIISGTTAPDKVDVVFPGIPPKITAASFKVYKEPASTISYAYTAAEVIIKTGELELKRVFRLYNDCPAIACDYFVRGAAGQWSGAAVEGESFQNIEDENAKRAAAARTVITEKIPISGNHWQVRSVEFFDASDYNNNLVQEYSRLVYRQENRMRGNLFFARNQLNKAGFFLLKEAPTSSVQLQYPGFDFTTKWGEIKVVGLGVSPGDLNDTGWIKGYSVVTGVDEGDGETGFLKALRNYQCQQRIYAEERDAMILSNTWGDRHQDTRVNEKFILQEIEAAAKLGITHMQVDDGWQKGITSNSAYGGSLAGIWRNPYYWQVDSVKFPHGLSYVLNAAKNKGIKMSLWFNPSTDSSFANWEKDADVLIDQYRKYGISMWKIDGVQVNDKKGEINFRNFLDKVMLATNNEAVFNLDVTAGRRFGYHYMHTYGNLFLENRYTDWGNYYPHYTLRNLWQLSKYMPAQRLQMEFLNKWRNGSKYPDNDILAPGNYSFDYLFAITMVAQPLAWFEVSGLPEEAFATAALIKKYKSISKDLHAGNIFPIGEEPGGFSWTGFQSVQDNSGYILLFRENNDNSQQSIKTLLPAGKKISVKLIAGNGKNFNAVTGQDGRIRFEISQPKSFVLYHYRII